MTAVKSGNNGERGDPFENDVGNRDGVLTSMFLVATAVIPAVYNSGDHIVQVRKMLLEADPVSLGA